MDMKDRAEKAQILPYSYLTTDLGDALFKVKKVQQHNHRTAGGGRDLLRSPGSTPSSSKSS